MNIKNIFNKYNIEYLTFGKNVKRGNINIPCPFGCSDPSQHLGINIQTGYYGCWLNRDHSGKDFRKLLKKVLNCSFEEADRIVNDVNVILNESEFANLFNNDSIVKDIDSVGGVLTLIMPNDFNEFVDYGMSTGWGKLFYNYLTYRGFASPWVLIKEYGIKYSMSGDYRHRLIFPLYMDNKLVTWTTRSILKNPGLKHLDLSKEKSVRHCNYSLSNYDKIKKGGDVLYIVEGMFDFLKVDYFSKSDVNATCIFTKNVTDVQIYLLAQMSKIYKKLIIMFDRGAFSDALRLQSTLSFLNNVSVVDTPKGYNDPGELSGEVVYSYCT